MFSLTGINGNGQYLRGYPRNNEKRLNRYGNCVVMFYRWTNSYSGTTKTGTRTRRIKERMMMDRLYWFNRRLSALTYAWSLIRFLKSCLEMNVCWNVHIFYRRDVCKTWTVHNSFHYSIFIRMYFVFQLKFRCNSDFHIDQNVLNLLLQNTDFCLS